MTQDQHVAFESHPQSLGARLRAARERSGRSIDQVAAVLKVPMALVEAAESDDFDRLGAPVYVRGHLMAYARLIGISASDVEQALTGHSGSAPQLVALAPSTRLQRFADRVARRAVYVVLTSAIVLPVVWYATQPGLHDARVALNPLDLPAVDNAPDVADADSPSPQSTTKPAKDYPIVASLAPFYAKQGKQTAVAPLGEAAPSQDEQGLTLHLVDASWVEIYDGEGRVIEQALLPAGSERRFDAGQVSRVTLGNADAVVVRQAGRDVDVSAYKRANVARFEISSDGSLQPVGG